MATSESRIAIVDIDQMSASAAATAINAAIETLEAAGFVAREIKTEYVDVPGKPKHMATILAALPEHLASAGVFAGVLCNAVVAAADASGGSTDSALTVDLEDLNGNALAKEGIVKVTVTGTEYSGEEALISTATFATATKGSILASGNGWAVVKCDANGQFACTLANSADETDYVSASTPDGGVDALADAVVVVGCVPDDVTWAA